MKHNPREGISAYDKSPKRRDEIGSDAYKKRKYWDLLNESKGEIDLFGFVGMPNKEQAYNYMRYRMPNFKQFRLSRMVAERIDLSSDAKLVYACIASFGQNPRLYQAEIAGLCGLEMRKVQLALYDLAQYGLIRIDKRYYHPTRRAPSVYVRLPFAERFTKDRQDKPGMFRSKAKDLEERIRDRFEF